MYKPPVSPSVAGCGPLASTPTFSAFSTTPRSYGSSSSSFSNSSSNTSQSSFPSQPGSSVFVAPSSSNRPSRSVSLQPSATPTKTIPQNTPSSEFLSVTGTTPSSSSSFSSSLRLRPRFSPSFSPALQIQDEESSLPSFAPLDDNRNSNNSSSVLNSHGSSKLSEEILAGTPLVGDGSEKVINSEEKTAGGKTSAKEQVLLWLNLIIMFLSYFAFSALAPFWPDVATKCGLAPTMIGFVTSAYPLGMFCSSLMTGYVIPVLGTKTILTGALILASIFSVAFGSIPWFMCGFYDPNSIFGVFLSVRFLQGMMSGVLETCIMFSISAFFPDRIGQILAYQELVIGVACMIGPLLGGLMYNLLHFFWTFIVFAVFFIVLLALVLLFFPDITKNTKEDSSQKDEGGSLLAVMSGPLAFSLFILFITAILNAFMVPILPLYLDAAFGWGPFLTGAVFGVSSLFYGVTATIVGHVTDNMNITASGTYKYCYAIGFVVQAVGYWLLGPIPVTGIACPTTVFISFCFIGIGFAFCLIPTLPDMQLCTAITAGVDSDANKSVISGVWQATYAIAMATGAPLAGVLYEQIGFYDSSAICVCLALITTLPSIAFGYIYSKNH